MWIITDSNKEKLWVWHKKVFKRVNYFNITGYQSFYIFIWEQNVTMWTTTKLCSFIIVSALRFIFQHHKVKIILMFTVNNDCDLELDWKADWLSLNRLKSGSILSRKYLKKISIISDNSSLSWLHCKLLYDLLLRDFERVEFVNLLNAYLNSLITIENSEYAWWL